MTMASGRCGESGNACSVSLILTALKGCVRHHGHRFNLFHRYGLAGATRKYSSSQCSNLAHDVQSKRIYHIITTLITIIAALSYFAMATGTGFRLNFIVLHERHLHGIPDTLKTVIRQVFWARYVDWTLTTPLILLDLFLLAGMSGANILVAVVADLIMCLTGLFAAFGHKDSGSKWGW